MSYLVLSQDDLEMVLRLMAALVAGMLIGYERSFHGRPAGFRTHALVCMASSLLMLVTVYEAHWVRAHADLVRLDPTRMAQGIMTGIGFLGAGVIMKEGFCVRGLTTAASIWITAAIGILSGIGFYFPLVLSVLLTIITLSVFRWIEARMPTQAYYHFEIQLLRFSGMTEESLRSLIEGHGFSIANFSYHMEGEQGIRHHTMILRTTDRTRVTILAEKLTPMETVHDFRIVPTGD
ncbi:MgtC/SapB family protein [Desulfobotulus sp. H1]|uniref:MgtC/SapB family protein n=1 Tax=Desulfobotulus pelophilus TaxID=2823377 RepID=A0ABT3N7L8_9BACT|nr:MgtC/SapB family protein [Desulfobotulus pelophilus]MCW7753459.1 MgtC/SapB family protein [Desulfobotulus pelophilus]